MLMVPHCCSAFSMNSSCSSSWVNHDVLPQGSSLSPPILPECCCTVMVNALHPASWSTNWPSGYARSSVPVQDRAGEERLGQRRAGRSPASRRSTELCRQLRAYPELFTPHPHPQHIHSRCLDLSEHRTWELSAHVAQGGNELKLSLEVGAGQ